ncbi:aminopeptidase N, partial [Enterobacter hormaechei]|nr:aminopeptidase N [Enterobacter hormaechei]
ITHIDLDFELNAEKTTVTAISQVKRQVNDITPLVLDGENLTLKSLYIDDKAWEHYQEQEGKLQIEQLPAQFTLKIVNEINPAANTALEGLYVSGDALCTQCEAE